MTQRLVDVNVTNMVLHLNNEGYYRSSGSGELRVNKDGTAQAQFKVYVKPRYVINNLSYSFSDSSLFTRDWKLTKKGTYLKKGDPIRLEVIEAERARIDAELKSKGYYLFNPSYLIIKVDSTIGHTDSTLKQQQANLYMEVKPGTDQIALKPYYINQLYVRTGTSDNKFSDYEIDKKASIRSGLNIEDPGKIFKRRIFYDAIGFRTGDLYTSKIHSISLSRLINLKVFKFVKNRFELVPRSDSALLDVHYDLAPLKKKTLQSELSASTKSNNLFGSQIDGTWINRNVFKGAETLTINPYFGFDFQLGGNGQNSSKTGKEYLRYGARADLTFPRFVVPFKRIRTKKNEILPKTIVSFDFENRNQLGLFTTTSVRVDWSYIWRKNSTFEHTITPFSVNFIQPRNVQTEAVADIIFDINTNPLEVERYLRILETSYFIMGSNYSVTYRPVTKPFKKNRFVMIGGLDYGGNLISLLMPKNRDKSLPKEFIGVPILQFAKLDTEVRYSRVITRRITFANRFIGGIAAPYGNSSTMQIPQFKQYFAGGSTGIRAFRARSLGPGAYRPDSMTIAQLGYQSFGDIRLELNSEIRLKFTDLIHGAFFIDAGNIWSLPDSKRSGYDSRAIFGKNFMDQIALGGGIGLRLDLSFFILRLDLATPFRKPWYSQTIDANGASYKNPWVFREVNLSSKNWRKENLVLNIAFGLPF